jgi:hypothetical protein
MLISAVYTVPTASAARLHTLDSGRATWWTATSKRRKADPRRSDGVRSTTIPSGVLELSGPPAEPSRPNHSASWAATYVRLKTVHATADQ